MSATTNVEELTSAALAAPELADGEDTTGQEPVDVGSLVAFLTNMPQPVSTPPTDLNNLSTTGAVLPAMPDELWEEIFSNLEVGDLISVRLTCRYFEDLATPIFFSTFIFRPHLHSVTLFNQVFKKKYIKKLRFATGTVGIQSSAGILGSQYQLGYNSVLDGHNLAGATGENLLASFRQVLDAAIKEYVDWNEKWHLGQSGLYQNQHALHAILAAASKLDTIEICQKDCTFTNPLLLDCWIRNHDSNSDRIALEFAELLRALPGSKRKIVNLCHDELSQSFFLLNPIGLTHLAKPLRNLTNLRLNFYIKKDNAAPFVKFWSGLGHFLKSIPKLKVLRFGFDKEMSCQEPQWITGYQRPSRRDANMYYVPLWNVLGEHTWTALETLRLDGLLVCESGLTQLLVRHARTLQHLELVDNGLWSGSYRGLLASLKEHLKLESFRISGFAQALHTEFDAWVLAPTTPSHEGSMLSDQLGKFLAEKRRLTTPAGMSSVAVTARLEAFVKGGRSEEWPMTADDVQRILMHHDHHCTYKCVDSNHTINTNWDARANAISLSEPTPGGYRSTYIGEHRFLYEHPSTDNDNSGPIGMREARQVMIERMLAQIPRYGHEQELFRRAIESGQNKWQWALPSRT